MIPIPPIPNFVRSLFTLHRPGGAKDGVPTPRFAVAALAVGAGSVLFLGACTTHTPPDELAQAVNTGERPVAMLGEAVFFNGAIAATVTISRGIGHGLAGGGRHGKNGQQEMPDVSAMETDEATAYIRAKVAVGSPLAPVTLHLKLKNQSKETFAVEVLDFDSDLGNFAVTPSKLALAPDQTSEPDPMISQLGVGSYEIPVKVTLRRGNLKETQTVLVRSIAHPPTSPTSPPPAPTPAS